MIPLDRMPKSSHSEWIRRVNAMSREEWLVWLMGAMEEIELAYRTEAS